MDKLNVAIADDNTKMTDMLGQMIEEDKDLELVGKAHNGEEICNIIKDKEPDVVILDIIMPKMDGLSVMEKFSHNANVKDWGQKSAGDCKARYHRNQKASAGEESGNRCDEYHS